MSAMITAEYLLPVPSALDCNQILSFMAPRIIGGTEVFSGGLYMRTFRYKEEKGWFSLRSLTDKAALELKIAAIGERCIPEIRRRVRRMFDLDTDHSAIAEQFAEDPLLSRGMKRGFVPGLPVAFEPFEFTIRAILGQQITVKAATTLAGRIAERANLRGGADFPDGLDYLFPDPEELTRTDLEGLGITKTRIATIRTVTDAVLENRVSLSPDQAFDAFEKEFSALKGIGSWTVNYVAMRGLGMKDAFPAADLGVIKALTGEGKKPSAKEITARAEQWRPWRSYAALCLWNISA